MNIHQDDSDLFDKFCLTGDALYFTLMSEKNQQLALQEARKAFKKTDSNRHISSKILNIFGQYETSNERDDSPEVLLERFSVGITGAFPGDMIIGQQKAVHGTIAKIHDNIVFPEKRKLDILRKDKAVWNDFLNKLKTIPYYEDMTLKEREDWLAINQDPTDSTIAEYHQKIEFIQPGNGEFLKKINEDQTAELFTAERKFSAKEIYEIFTRNKPSNARRPTLMLYKGYWRLSIDYEYADKFNGRVIDVSQGKILAGAESSQRKKLIILGNLCGDYKKDKKDKNNYQKDTTKNVKIGFLVEFSSRKIDDEFFKKVIFDTIQTTEKAYSKVFNYLTGWTPGAYKSLLQKIIRYASEKIIIENVQYSSELVLLVCLSHLCQHAGSLVPDIQRFVTGLESAFKRVFVSIAEDSYFDDKHSALTLTSCALLAQRVKKWIPNEKHIKVLFTSALYSYNSKKAYIYDIMKYKEEKPFDFKNSSNEWQLASAIFDELKSFQSDLALYRDIATQYSTGNIKSIEMIQRPETMNIRQFVDQHWAPNVAYFYEQEKIDYFIEKSSTKELYKTLFNDLWNKSSGLNIRRYKQGANFSQRENIPQVPDYISQAQEKFLQANFEFIKKKDIPVKKSFYTSEYKLPESWISALLGGIEIKGKQPIIVSLKPESIYEFSAMRKPARETKEDDRLNEEEQEKAIEKVKEILRKGYPLNSVNPPHESLKGLKIYLDDSGDEMVYTFTSSQNSAKKEWKDISTITIKVPMMSNEICDVYLNTCTGIGSIEQLKELLENGEPIIVQKVLYILRSKKSFYEFPRIGREGGGTKERVSKDDTKIFKLFVQVANLLPALIVPRKNNPTIFDFKHRTVLWDISEKLLSNTLRKTPMKFFKSNDYYDHRGYKLKNYQEDALFEMKQKNTRGNFLWLVTGSGKSKVSIEYITQTLKSIKPEYIIYTLPAEAISSVGQEIKSYGYEVDLVIPIKDKSGDYPKFMNIVECNKIRKGVVTIIEHDYLRRCYETLIEIAPKTFIVFDECHKLLNDSLRTGSALDIARLAKQFIAMTGTPVVDNKVYKLINWFELIYEEIEITEKNFWVGANSMISKLVQLNIKINEEEVVSQFKPSEWSKYETLVPPIMGGNNSYPQQSDLLQASNLCYSVCNRDMVKKTIENLEYGVHLISRNKEHTQELFNLLVKEGVKENDIKMLLNKSDSLKLTTETVQKKQVHDYKVVITPQYKSSGYDIAKLSVQITSVYPSNQANRTQLKGRIHRLSQKRQEVTYITVHCGILTRIMENHRKATSLQNALGDLASHIKL